ncbi:YegP family protein [Pseudidiomarina aestuarii]|uniref:YegP family protein n=1 Tax=Pseudidiomarina aestuarii TaxID=624146 RepID=UPI003A975E61
MSARYEIYLGSNNQYYFRLKAGNSEIILQSEGYVSRQGAENGVQSVRQHSPHDRFYSRETSLNYQYYFTLHAINSQVIGTSEMYTSTTGREIGIESVKRNGPTAPLHHI